MENNNETYQFKTNINCSGCVAKVKPFLDNAEDICEWDVDVKNRDKVLTVKSEGITKEEVISAVQKAGFKVELLNQ